MLNFFHFRLFEILGYLFRPNPIHNQQVTCEGPFSIASVISAQSSSKYPMKSFKHESCEFILPKSFSFNFDAKRMKKEAFFWVKIYEVSKMIIITRENIISTKIVVTFSEFLRRFRIWFPFNHTRSLSGDNFPYIWPNFDLEAPLAPRAVSTLMS